MKKELTFFESACIIAGTGIGSGVMAIPFLFEQAGIAGGIIVFLIAYTVSILMHYMIADLFLNAGGDYQVTTVVNRFLFCGKYKKMFALVFFVFISIMLLANLSAYITGGADILVSLTDMGAIPARILIYILAIVPVLFGLKAIGVGEKIIMVAIIVLVCSLTAVSCFHINPQISWGGSISSILALFSIVMFSLNAMFAVPQVVEGLQHNKKRIKGAISLGLTMNLLLSALICFAAIVSSAEVTRVAIIGWSSALGPAVRLLASLFVVLAMLTSFWVIAFALAEIIQQQFKLSLRRCYFLSTFPSLLVSFIIIASFTDLVRTAGGAIAVMVAILLVPAYRNSIKSAGESLILKGLGEKKAIMVIIVLASILMAVGAVC